jgi:hypothetical protein
VGRGIGAGAALLLATACAVQELPPCFSDSDCPVGERCDIFTGDCRLVADAGPDDVGGGCAPAACTASCLAGGYASGACDGTTCRCSGTPTDGGPDDAPACDPAACTASCASIGAIGTCEDSGCVCGSAADADADADVRDDAPAPDEATPTDDGARDDAAVDDTAVEDAAIEDTAVEDVATDDAGAPEDSGPPTGPCGGPFSGSGDSGESGWYCLGDYTFRAIAGNMYTISTCGSCTGDTYVQVTGACSCSDDDGCGDLCSECSCTATSDGDVNICASTYSLSSATWSYTVTGTCRL